MNTMNTPYVPVETIAEAAFHGVDLINGDGRKLLIPPDVTDFNTQLDRVHYTMASNYYDWMTLEQLALLSGYGQSQIPALSARLRDLRKVGYRIDRRRHPKVGGGAQIFEYRYAGIHAMR
jgi:hypothetical protein